MGRTEQIGVQILIGLLDVAHIRADAVQMTADVVECVVAQAVTAGFHHFKLGGMLANVVAHHEERGLHAVAVEDIEHPGGDFGNGAVVEREVDRALRRIHPPQGVGIEPTEKKGGLFDDHARSVKLEITVSFVFTAVAGGGSSGTTRIHRGDEHMAGGGALQLVDSLDVAAGKR